ncbi:MAG TPA: NIPSNAP family protein, partial [Gaiellaceae bacterium]|nr:NIPSNAP family protein [Gaiellaceae bacterium]
RGHHVSAMQTQLRIYTVRPGRLDAWVEEWRERIYPLRERSGFRVLGAWTIPEEDRFVWILDYDGPGSWKQAERDYYTSPERAAVDPDPTRHLAATESWMLRPVLSG